MNVVEHLASLRVNVHGKHGSMKAITSAPLSVKVVFDDGTDGWYDMYEVEVMQKVEPLPLPG